MRYILQKLFNQHYMQFFIVISIMILYPEPVTSEKINPLCGPQSLLMICERYGIDTNLEEICNLTGYDKQLGTTMLGLYHASQIKGLSVIPVRLEFSELCKTKNYSIAYMDGKHFLVFCGCNGENVLLQNPPNAPYKLPKKTFLKRWDGEILLFGDNAEELKTKLSLKNNKTLNGPEIHFNHTSHYFGLVEEGTELSHTFGFENVGTDILNVAVRSSCNCTVALPSGKKFSPGSSGEICIKFDTQGKKGQTLQEVYVRSNDTYEQIIKLTVAATIRSGVKIVPERIQLGELRPGQKIKREILVIDQGDGTLKVDNVIGTSKVEAKIFPFEEKNNIRFIPILLSIKGGNRTGLFEENITIITNSQKSNRYNIQISGNIVGDIKIFPPRLYFGKLEKNTVSVREATIVPTNKRKFNITKVEYTSPYINAKVNQCNHKSQYRLITTLRAPDMKATVRDTISVYLNGDKHPILNIPLYASIK